MCGRYASSRNPESLVEEFEVERVAFRAPIEPDYNVAPTKDVYAVLTRPERLEDGTRGAPLRQLRILRWGLIPSWAKDAAIGSRLINARMETLSEKPAFRKAFASRRCLLPADGYFEWYGQVKGKKQPYFIRPRDGASLAMAGLYEIWRDQSKPAEGPDAFRWTSTVITTTAEDSVGQIHDRMPMLVEPARWAEWLDPSVTDLTSLDDLLIPAAPGRLEAFAVSTDVNNVRNNGPSLIEALPPEPW